MIREWEQANIPISYWCWWLRARPFLQTVIILRGGVFNEIVDINVCWNYHKVNVRIRFEGGVGKRNSGPLECSFPTDWPRDFVWPERDNNSNHFSQWIFPPSSLLPPLRVSPATLQYDRCEKKEEEQQSKKADKNYHQYEVKVLFAGIFWCRRSGLSGNCHPHSNQGNIGFLIQISCVARL